MYFAAIYRCYPCPLPFNNDPFLGGTAPPTRNFNWLRMVNPWVNGCEAYMEEGVVS